MPRPGDQVHALESGPRVAARLRSKAMTQPPLPERVHVREVGPRDGFQNEPEQIPTDDKVRLIEALGAAGYQRMEVASFVRADVLPQLADAVEVLQRIDLPDDVARRVLVPNPRGLAAALEHHALFEEVGVFASASETHNKKNVNRTVAETMDQLRGMIPDVTGAGLKCTGVVATAFGCPYEGAVDPGRVFALCGEMAAAGATEIGFGDTTGMANPRQVRAFFARAFDELPGVELTAHFHNTRGQGLANALAALESGVTSFESSFGELGGCPVPKGATGNVASEDLVSMLHEMGVGTGVDLPRLVAASRDVQEVLGRRLTSHVIVAGPIDWHTETAGKEEAHV